MEVMGRVNALQVKMQGLKGRLKEEKQDGIKKDTQIDKLLEMVDEGKKDRESAEKETKRLWHEAEKSKRGRM
jgi:predicted  nucleic acid-binding Zn-ribbon protein